jgi:hypothetical protein
LTLHPKTAAIIRLHTKIRIGFSLLVEQSRDQNTIPSVDTLYNIPPRVPTIGPVSGSAKRRLAVAGRWGIGLNVSDRR